MLRGISSNILFAKFNRASSISCMVLKLKSLKKFSDKSRRLKTVGLLHLSPNDLEWNLLFLNLSTSNLLGINTSNVEMWHCWSERNCNFFGHWKSWEIVANMFSSKYNVSRVSGSDNEAMLSNLLSRRFRNFNGKLVENVLSLLWERSNLNGCENKLNCSIWLWARFIISNLDSFEMISYSIQTNCCSWGQVVVIWKPLQIQVQEHLLDNFSSLILQYSMGPVEWFPKCCSCSRQVPVAILPGFMFSIPSS